MDDDRISTDDETDTTMKSFGSGLDEIAFKPLGHRIKIRVGHRLKHVRRFEYGIALVHERIGQHNADQGFDIDD